MEFRCCVSLVICPRERAPGTHHIGGWVVHRAGLDSVENGKSLSLPGFETTFADLPARDLVTLAFRVFRQANSKGF
jgi:hypothetical protein